MMTAAVRAARAFAFVPLLASCDSQRIEYFKTSIVLGAELNAHVSVAAHSAIRSLLNYYVDTACRGTVWVPVVQIRRADLSPERTDSVPDPLSGIDRWRRNNKLLPVPNLIAAYDQDLQTLRLPQILSAKSDSLVDVATLQRDYPSAELLVLDDSIATRTATLRRKLSQRLCSGSGSDFAIILYRPLASDIDRINRSIARKQSLAERKSIVDTTVRRYETLARGDPFALYALSKTIIYGEDHHEAFEMLQSAARSAIRQGKAAELTRLISEDIQLDLNRSRNDRTTWKLTTRDHSSHWLPIIRALASSDSSMLHSAH